MKRHLFSVCDVVCGHDVEVRSMNSRLEIDLLSHTDLVLFHLVRSRTSYLHREEYRSNADEQACGGVLPPLRRPACVP